MAIYKMDCRKCTNKYIGFYNGQHCSWCKPMVNGIHPLKWEWHDEDTKKDTCICEYFQVDQCQTELKLV
jgi:hypothetical protein